MMEVSSPDWYPPSPGLCVLPELCHASGVKLGDWVELDLGELSVTSGEILLNCTPVVL